METPQKNLLTGADLLDRVLGNPEKYARLVNKSYHKELPLVSLCYSSMCNLGRPDDPRWDEVTLSCRGVIINTETKEIVSKAWNKFFNYDPQINKLDITQNDSYILEKLDGSLGISYREPGTNRVRIATKNSFYSEMAIVANKWIDKKIETLGYDPFIDGFTYLFEIIYPENYSTLIPYGDRKECVLLGIIYNFTGGELSVDHVDDWAKEHGFSRPKRYRFKDFISIVEHCKSLPWNDEGYVVTLLTGDGSFKYKIKGDKFVELHRLVFGLGPRRIWKSVRDGIDVPLMLEAVPSEIKAAKLEIYNKVISDRDEIVANARIKFQEIFEEGISRKDFALKTQALPKQYKGLMFTLLDGNEEKLYLGAIKQIEDNFKQKDEEEENIE